MENKKFEEIKNDIQSIIDCIAKKQNIEANTKIVEIRETLNDLLDVTNDETIIREISKYQVLLDYLSEKISWSLN